MFKDKLKDSLEKFYDFEMVFFQFAILYSLFTFADAEYTFILLVKGRRRRQICIKLINDDSSVKVLLSTWEQNHYAC